jgi:mono/diheme cytochrome c family protein
MTNSRSIVGATTPAEASPTQATARTAFNYEIYEVWLLAAGIMLFFVVVAAFLANAAVSDPAVRWRFDAARGKQLYADHCAACHQRDGQGVAGAFPPLKGSGVVNKDDATKQMHIVLAGLQGAKAGGVVYKNAMPPFGDTLSDADIADVVDYVRGSWGNHGRPVTAGQVAAERATGN